MSWRLSLVLRIFCYALFSSFFFVEAAALCSIVLRHASVPKVTCVFFSYFFSFGLFRDVDFSEYFFLTISAFCLYREYVVRSLLPNGDFLPCDHGLDF